MAIIKNPRLERKKFIILTSTLTIYPVIQDMTKTLSLPYRQGDCLSRRRLPIMLRLRLAFLGRPDMGGPSCCCGRYRSLTNKTTASVVDGCQSCFAFGLHSWAVLTWAVPVAVAVAIAPLPARRLPQYDGFEGTCRRVGLFVFRSLAFSCMPGLLPGSPGCMTRRRRVSV